MLVRLGCSVDIAKNGLEALDAVASKTYDLVLMDCMMPKMDGYTATAEIRRRQNAKQLPNFPIVAMTANAMEGDREKCLLAGMDDYLPKPFNSDSLLKMVKAWVKQSNVFIADSSIPLKTNETLLDDETLEAIYALLEKSRGRNDSFLQRVVSSYMGEAGTSDDPKPTPSQNATRGEPSQPTINMAKIENHSGYGSRRQ